MSDPQAEEAHPNDCPFCASSNLEMSKCINSYWMKCLDCGADGPDKKGRLAAIQAWNVPTDDIEGVEFNERHLRKDCDRLRKALDEAKGEIR